MRTVFLMLPMCLALLASHSIACAPIEPSTTQLSGKLVLLNYPGPPNYESVTAGDRLDPQWMLSLSSPLCVQVSQLEALSDISEIQLILPIDGVKWGALQGKQVLVFGTLFRAHTINHRTDILMSVKDLRPNNSFKADNQPLRGRLRP